MLEKKSFKGLYLAQIKGFLSGILKYIMLKKTEGNQLPRCRQFAPNYSKCPTEDFLSPDVSLPLPLTLTSADPLFPMCSQTKSRSLSTPPGYPLQYSLETISRALTPGWETALGRITSKAVSTNPESVARQTLTQEGNLDS